MTETKKSSGQGVRSVSKGAAVVSQTVVSASGAKVKVTEIRLTESANKSLSTQVSKLGASR